jgi:DNA/RNA endonuclease YhcR with UshA esterase domain
MIKQLLRFFGVTFETKEQKSKRISTIIENDPELKKIDAEIARLDNRSGQLSPEFVKILKKYGAY